MKLIVFVPLYGYLHFLKNSALFFLSKVEDATIQEISLKKMSQRMITECTNLISNETKKTKLAIKRFLTDLYSDQHLYG